MFFGFTSALLFQCVFAACADGFHVRSFNLSMWFITLYVVLNLEQSWLDVRHQFSEIAKDVSRKKSSPVFTFILGIEICFLKLLEVFVVFQDCGS